MTHIAQDALHGRLPRRARVMDQWPSGGPNCTNNELVAEFTRHLRPTMKARVLSVTPTPAAVPVDTSEADAAVVALARVGITAHAA